MGGVLTGGDSILTNLSFASFFFKYFSLRRFVLKKSGSFHFNYFIIINFDNYCYFFFLQPSWFNLLNFFFEQMDNFVCCYFI